MDDRWPQNQSNNKLSQDKKPQDQDLPLPSTPAVAPGTKEAEKISAIQGEIGKEVEVAREEAKEIEPGLEEVEVKEISLDKEVVELPEGLREIGVEALVPPEVPEELQPQAETMTLPMTKSEAIVGASRPIVNSFLWLYTHFTRLVRKVGGGFRYVFRNLGGQRVKG